jgi:tetratricopeptide (TPR) repeat protein
MSRWDEKLKKAEELVLESKYREALAIAEAILAEDTRFARAYALRGKVYALEQDWDDALSELDRAIELDPLLAEAWLERGSIKLMSGMLEPAAEDLQRAVELDASLEGKANLIVETYAEIVKKEQAKRLEP